MFEKKTILITGGTGSFGNAFLKSINLNKLKEVRIFSRDEKKQDDLRKKMNSKKIKFIIGDIRDDLSVNNAVKGVNFIFHAAALKQVPTCEFFPMEAVKTNIIGAENITNSAINNNVEKIVMLSTDKAVYPINAMGLTKSIMEKIMLSKARQSKKTILCCTRYGNVMGSRGSVIPLFIDQIKQNKSLTVTNPKMTRFLMSLEDSVDLVKFAFKNANTGDIFVQKSPSATIATIAKSVQNIFNSKKQIKIIGTRHGEKLYESLVSKEEMTKAISYNKFYKIPNDNRDLNYDNYFLEGKIKKLDNEYNSHNTKILNIKQTTKLIKKTFNL